MAKANARSRWEKGETGNTKAHREARKADLLARFGPRGADQRTTGATTPSAWCYLCGMPHSKAGHEALEELKSAEAIKKAQAAAARTSARRQAIGQRRSSVRR